MGFGIDKVGVYTKWEIPFGSDSDWEDDSWIIEHLRQLADKLESDNPRIMNVGIRTKIPWFLYGRSHWY